MTHQEIDRRVTECHLPFNPMRPLGHAIQAERRPRHGPEKSSQNGLEFPSWN